MRVWHAIPLLGVLGLGRGLGAVGPGLRSHAGTGCVADGPAGVKPGPEGSEVGVRCGVGRARGVHVGSPLEPAR